MIRYSGTSYVSLDDEFPRGKFRGCTVREVLAHNPAYITWCINNWDDGFELDNEAYEVYEQSI